jgi:transcription antitermination protein NusB
VKSRRLAREAALQALYEIEVGKRERLEAVLDIRRNDELPQELQEFAQSLVRKTVDHLKELDAALAPLVQEWDFERLAAVDRNILRLAACELYHFPQIPPAVSIDEAIEIAKKYSTAESGRFVNGILGRLLADTPKAQWDPSQVVHEVEEKAPPEQEVEVEVIQEESPEAEELQRVGLWKVRKAPEDQGE